MQKNLAGIEKDIPSGGAGTFSLTENIRSAAAARGVRRPELTVRVAKPSNLKQILNQPGQKALLIVHSNGCGYCRALVDTLADATVNLQKLNDFTPRILMFETGKAENQAAGGIFDEVRYVPDFLIAENRDGVVKMYKWIDAHLITTSKTETGKIVKKVPFDALSRVFQSTAGKSTAGTSNHVNAMRKLGFF